MSEQLGVLERAANIAKENLSKIQAPMVKKAQAEAKVAAENKTKLEQVEKDKGIELAKQQEVKTKEDERILSEDDTKLAEADKKRKSELLDIKRKEEDTPEFKIKRVQESTQKRIDEIKSEQLAKENKTSAELAALKAELEELRKPKQQEDFKAKIKREQSEQIAKFVEEDKSKPKEERREMSKDDLDSWYLDDPVEATKWIQRTEYRRLRDLEKAEEVASKPVDTSDVKKTLTKEFIEKQLASRAKLIEKFPSLIPSKDKIIEIRNKLGLPLDRALNESELDTFNKEFAIQNKEYQLAMTISKEFPKFLEETNGPELMMAEMEKRLKKPEQKTGKIELTQEELDAKIQDEIDRRRRVDGEGIISTNGGKKVENSDKQKSELRQEQEKIAKKAGMTIEQLDARIARRGNIKGASSGGAED